MKKILLYAGALSSIVAPTAISLACGGSRVIKSQVPRTETLEEKIKRLEQQSKDLENTIAKLVAEQVDAAKLGQTQNELEVVKQQLDALRAEKEGVQSLEEFREQLESNLSPFVKNNWLQDRATINDFITPRNAGEPGHIVTDLEKAIHTAAINNLKSSLPFTKEFDNSIKSAWMLLNDNIINQESAFEPISDTNRTNANELTNVQLDANFKTLSATDQFDQILTKLFGNVRRRQMSSGNILVSVRRKGGALPIGFTKDVTVSSAFATQFNGGSTTVTGANGVNKILFAIDEENNLLKVWTKGRVAVPTLGEEIARYQPQWQQDAAIVAEIAKIGLNINSVMTPENYMKVIRYFFVPTSLNAVNKFANARRWQDGYILKKVPGDKEHDHSSGFDVIKKLSSPLTWNFDDYTINSAGLAAKQTMMNNGNIARFDDKDFYNDANASKYDASLWENQFEIYNGKLTAKGWVFDHIFQGLNVEDATVENLDRYHSFYDRNVNSIRFMKDTYSLLISSHVSETNNSDQILDFAVKPNGYSKIVYRDSMTLPGMQPDARETFADREDIYFNLGGQTALNKEVLNRAYTVDEFKQVLAQAQSMLQSFKTMASGYLLDNFIGDLIDVVSKLDVLKLTTKAIETILDGLKKRTDININWFLATLAAQTKNPSYAMTMLAARSDNHNALSLEALSFDNVLNVMIAMAKVVSPDLFKNGDLIRV